MQDSNSHDSKEIQNRRDVAARNAKVFPRLAARLVKLGLTPNQISVLSSVFAIGAACALLGSRIELDAKLTVLLLVLAIVGIQMRLVCNLIDGLMAIEGGLKTPAGELFNDVPDRISDSVIFIAAGYVAQSFFAHGIELGWLTALLSVGTAYVRTLGASMTGKNDFAGPMAKQHRMFVITLACLASCLEVFSAFPVGSSLTVALAIIALGSFATCINRLRKIRSHMEQA